MAITIPSISDISAAWVAGAGAGAANYRRGVQNSAVDWAGPTADAQDTWKTAVIEAAGTDRFRTGVTNAGNTRWRDRAAGLGAQRFAQGVAAATTEFRDGFEPFRSVIEGINLPPRGARGSAANLQRVAAVTDALHQERLRQLGS